MQFQKTLPRYRDCGTDYLELHDNHTVWELEIPSGKKNSEADSDELFNYLVDAAIEMFEETTKEPVYLLGRSGRHVCVYDTPRNSKRYQYLRKVALELESWVIELFNNYYLEE